MASVENKPVKADKGDRVEIFVPRGNANDDPNLFISVNGVNYLLPRGKKSSVPECVATEFYRAQAAQENLDATVAARLIRE